MRNAILGNNLNYDLYSKDSVEGLNQIDLIFGVIFLVPVVRRLDNAIQRISRYPVDKC